MDDFFYKRLNPTQTIKEFLPSLIEVFVAFYGEEERENIEKKFNNLLVVGYSSPKSISSILNHYRKKMSDDFVDKFLDNIKIGDFNKEQLKKCIFDNKELDYIYSHPIHSYLLYKEGNKNVNVKEDVIKFLNNFYPEVTSDNLDHLIETDYFSEVDKVLESYRNLLEEYNKKIESVKLWQDYVDKCELLENNLMKKYIKKYIEEIKELFTKLELDQIKEKLEDSYFSMYSLKKICPKIENYLGIDLDSPGLIDSFSEKNENILHDADKSFWQKENILNDRIKYFKNLGLDLGDDYEAYMNSEEAKSLIPSQEFINNIINKREHLNELFMIEYYNSLPEYVANSQKILDENLENKDISYNAVAYENNMTFIDPNMKKVGNEMVVYPILCFSMGNIPEYFDANLIHELNHVYELTLTEILSDCYLFKGGFEDLKLIPKDSKDDLESLKSDSNMRKYELFSEIINELISQDINQLAHEMGVHIFNTKEDGKIKGGTSYENAVFLVYQFYKTYKHEIIESRKKGDMTILLNKVGSDNFESLNDLLNDFRKKFPGNSIYVLHRDLENKEDTELTRKHAELKRKRDEILNKMAEYSYSK